jgi:hypothetical protein
MRFSNDEARRARTSRGFIRRPGGLCLSAGSHRASVTADRADLSDAPGRYSLQIGVRNFSADRDGAISFVFPATRPSCGPYLFDLIPMSRETDPFDEKTISLLAAGKPVRILSLNDIFGLPRDGNGTHVLSVDGRH